MFLFIFFLGGRYSLKKKKNKIQEYLKRNAFDYREIEEFIPSFFFSQIKTQQNVMSQASQALNLCRATAEFSGSTEQVEGERLLLVASKISFFFHFDSNFCQAKTLK